MLKKSSMACRNRKQHTDFNNTLYRMETVGYTIEKTKKRRADSDLYRASSFRKECESDVLSDQAVEVWACCVVAWSQVRDVDVRGFWLSCWAGCSGENWSFAGQSFVDREAKTCNTERRRAMQNVTFPFIGLYWLNCVVIFSVWVYKSNILFTFLLQSKRKLLLWFFIKT